MDVAVYRGRGAKIVLVHASIRPPLLAGQDHGPLHYLDTVDVDGRTLAGAWAAFADQMGSRFYAVLDEGDGLRLLAHRPANAPDQPAPSMEAP